MWMLTVAYAVCLIHERFGVTFGLIRVKMLFIVIKL